jgi:hypothetical protein
MLLSAQWCAGARVLLNGVPVRQPDAVISACRVVIQLFFSNELLYLGLLQ